MAEQWKDIPGYEGRYQVSDLGRVRALSFMQRYLLRGGKEAFRRTKPHDMAVNVQNGGYLMVHLNINSKRKAMTVHRLVALAFVPNPDNLPEVNHEDGDKTNCAACNLNWKTSSGNKAHAVDIGLNPSAIRVRVAGREYPSLARAVAATGLSRAAIRAAQ